MVAVDHHLVDAGDHRILLGRGDPGMGFGPCPLVVVDVAVAGGAAGDAAQRGQVAVLDRDVEVLDRRADHVLLRHLRRRAAGQQQRAEDRDGHQRGDDQQQRHHPAPAATGARRFGRLAAGRNELRRNGFLLSHRLGERVAAATPAGASDTGITSVAGSAGVSIFCVEPASNPDGAVKRRSAGCFVSSAGSWASASGDNKISVAGSCSGSVTASACWVSSVSSVASAAASAASSGWSGPDGFDIPAAVPP